MVYYDALMSSLGMATMTLPIQSSLILLALTTVKNEAFHMHTNRDISTDFFLIATLFLLLHSMKDWEDKKVDSPN